ncbi:MAG: tetratricopeptide repeat protein [Nocardiopsaceae bacterium]|nr:tetratricopeptide repeat protein [Nocardiopsaceae bacterium]
MPPNGSLSKADVRKLLGEAEREFGLGHLEAAAACTGNALAAAPSLPEAHKLIARLAADPAGGLRVFPLDDPLTLSMVLGHAHVAAAQHDFDRGLILLVKAQAFMPETPWADVPWVADPVTAAEARPGVIATLAVDINDIVRELDEPKRLPVVTPYLRLVRNGIEAHPDDARILGAAGFLFRRFDLAEAARYAERSDELAPIAASAVARSLIYQDQGRIDEAITAINQAVERAPDDPERYADACDLLIKAGRPSEALAYAQRGLDIDSHHACCEVSAAAAEFCQTRTAEHFDKPARRQSRASPSRARPGRSSDSSSASSAGSEKASGRGATGPPATAFGERLAGWNSPMRSGGGG